MPRLLRLFLILPLLALLLWGSSLARERREPTSLNLPGDLPLLSIRMLDVGQGDAILIQTPAGKNILIDAGPGAQLALLKRQLERLQVSAFSLVVATHPHEDHIGNLPWLIETFPVRTYTDPGTLHTTENFRLLMERLVQRKVPVREARRGQRYKLGDELFLDVLMPREPLLSETRSDLNNNSVVTRLIYRGFSMLFTGDAEIEAEARLIDDAVLLPTSVLKVGHHGSFSSTSPALLDRIRPKLAVASCGLNNDYGHPHGKTLRVLESRNVPLFRTDLDGQIQLITDGHRLWAQALARSRLLSPLPEPLSPDRVVGPIALDEEGEVRITADQQRQKQQGLLPVVEPSAPAEDALANAQAPVLTEGPIVSSKKWKVFHKSSCEAAQKLAPANRIYFASEDEARRSGRTPADDCR